MAKALRWVVLALVFAGQSAMAASCAPPAAATGFAAEVIALTNALRDRRGRAGLAPSARLAEAAQAHACDMARTGKFSHTGAGGSDLSDRVDATGYPWRFIAENIALGQRGPAEVVTAWEGSAGHRKNMLQRRASEIGIGIATGDGRLYWVMVLGDAR